AAAAERRLRPPSAQGTAPEPRASRRLARRGGAASAAGACQRRLRGAARAAGAARARRAAGAARGGGGGVAWDLPAELPPDRASARGAGAGDGLRKPVRARDRGGHPPPRAYLGGTVSTARPSARPVPNRRLPAALFGARLAARTAPGGARKAANAA